MKKIFLFIALLSAFSLQAKPRIDRAEPLCWWTEMNCPLTLMLQGDDLADAQVTIQQLHNGKLMKGECTGLQVTSQHNAESKNYLFVDLAVNQPGTYRIILKKNKRTTYVDYTIHTRREGSRERQGFTSADMIYLIMSDRFVDGDETPQSKSRLTARGCKPMSIHDLH